MLRTLISELAPRWRGGQRRRGRPSSPVATLRNATYGLTVCAERVAVLKAISEGASEFTRIAIAADTEALTPPCGACRQILWEFCGNIEIVLANLHGRSETLRLAEIFPRPFDSSFL